MVVTLGALLGDVPHTRAVRVTGTATDPDVDQRPRAHPIAVRGTDRDRRRAARRVPTTGLRSASLWAPVPHYVASPPNPPATRALLERLGQLADLELDLQGLDQLVDLWRVQVDHAIARQRRGHRPTCATSRTRVDAEDASERGIVLGGHPAGGGSVPNADDLAAEVEQFLRDQDDES